MKHLLAGLTVGLLIAMPGIAQVREFGIEEAPESEVEETEARESDPVVAQLQSLDLRERVCQLMLVTMGGSPTADSSDRALLEHYPPGGAIVPSLLTPGGAADYVDVLRGTEMEVIRGIPLLIGANLSDLPKHWQGDGKFFAPLPSLLAVSAAGDPDVTERYADFIVEHLSVMGFNLHLGPSLELAPSLPEAEGGIQCLGSDPKFVAETASVIFQTLDEAGLVGMPLGFPGGGWNREGHGPAVLLTPDAHLPQMDLFPYAEAVEAGVAIMHVGNTLVPTIDTAIPASQSRLVMQDILRQQLGFQGVIVAGPMDDSDITRLRDSSDAALTALESGADMIYWRGAGQRVMKSVDEIVQAVQAGDLSQDIVDAAVTRVLTLKQDFALLQRERPKASDSDKALRDKDQRDDVFYMERRSITLVQNRGNVLPLTKERSQPIGITGAVGVRELHEALEKHIKHIVLQPIVSARHGGQIFDFEIHRVITMLGDARTVICTLTPDLRAEGQVELIRCLKEAGANVVVVLLGYPESLAEVALADAILLSYCDPGKCQQSLKAVAEVLAGEGAINILSVSADVKTHVDKEEVFTVFDIIRAPAGRLPVAVESRFPAGLAVPYDPTLTLKKVRWDFGDGSRSKEQTAKKKFKTPGRYPVTLTVTDKTGEETSRTIHVVVE